VLVLDECGTAELEALDRYIAVERLHVRTFSVEELNEVELTGRRKGLRPADRSVLLREKELSGIVLSGDGGVRKECEEMALRCHGTLWCISELHGNGHYDAQKCLAVLDVLEAINKWLPKGEVERMRRELGG
jgi:hypothetical protein